jgi:hypothetical protein
VGPGPAFALEIRFKTFGLWSQPARAAGPLLDVGPCPHERLLQTGDGFGEVVVPVVPRVYDLRTRDVEPLGDLRGPDELLHVDLPSQAADAIDAWAAARGMLAYGRTRTVPSDARITAVLNRRERTR